MTMSGWADTGSSSQVKAVLDQRVLLSIEASFVWGRKHDKTEFPFEIACVRACVLEPQLKLRAPRVSSLEPCQPSSSSSSPVMTTAVGWSGTSMCRIVSLTCSVREIYMLWFNLSWCAVCEHACREATASIHLSVHIFCMDLSCIDSSVEIMLCIYI